MILSRTSSGDPVRRTAWGTILFGEEALPTAGCIEIADPLTTTGATFNRATGVSSNPKSCRGRTRPAVI